MERKTIAFGASLRRLMVLLLACALLTGCAHNPGEKQLYAKLIAGFEACGLDCTLMDEPVTEDAPIWESSAWRVLKVGGERVLSYFDESNRADYLAEQCAKTEGGHVTRFGLRFVLCYRGASQEVLDAMNTLDAESAVR